MVTREHPDERDWADEKREFVADRRDAIADQRDAAADSRDLVADAGEAEMDAWESALRQGDTGGEPSPISTGCPTRASGDVSSRPSPAERIRAHDQARLDRQELAADRQLASADRSEATKRREAAHPQTGLALAFAQIAQHLYSCGTYDEVLQRIAEAAVVTVTGCDMASVTVSQHGTYATAASTAPAAGAVDQAQYDAGEGPCLDAVDAPVVAAQSFPDSRWPALASQPAELGVQSAVSYQLAPEGVHSTSPGGSLNTYADTPGAFTDEAQQIGLVLAAHASLAAGAVRERGQLDQLADNLSTALLTRDVIGQAKGILMERLKLTPEESFDALRHASQRLNEKLRTVAERLAETGEFDANDLPPQ